MSTSEMEQAAEKGFEHTQLKTLRKYAKDLGVEAGPRAGAKLLRSRLNKAINAAGSDNEEATVAQEAVQQGTKGVTHSMLGGFDPKPMLKTGGRWGGRWHRVLLPNTGTGKSSRSTVPIGVNGDIIYIPYDRATDIPEPHFGVLSRARSANVVEKRKVRNDGTVDIVHELQEYPTHSFQDLGITPGTEDLPTGLHDYWKRQALKTDYFSRTSRRLLLQIHADVCAAKPRDEFKEMSDPEIRWDILVTLRMSEHMQEAQAA